MTRRKLAGLFGLTAVPFRARIGPRITPRHPKPRDHGHVPDQGETGASEGRVNACHIWRARTPPPDTSHSSQSGPDKTGATATKRGKMPPAAVHRRYTGHPAVMSKYRVIKSTGAPSISSGPAPGIRDLRHLYVSGRSLQELQSSGSSTSSANSP